MMLAQPAAVKNDTNKIEQVNNQFFFLFLCNNEVGFRIRSSKIV
jgi:hypothetical protein